MFPPGKFSRVALAAALLCALLLVLDLEFVRSLRSRLIISNSLDLAVLLLAAVSAFYIARRSTGYARQIWLLLAFAIALESAAQAISAYYQSFVPGSAGTPWPSDVLYFVWAAPVFMIFLPRSEDDPAGLDSLRFLDFLQIAIIAITVYFYFFYSPARWRGNESTLLRQILTLYIARDLILSISFFVRSRRSRASWLHSFSFALTFVFLAATFSDADYLFTLGTSASTATWADLLQMLPYAIVIILALSWKQPEPVPASASSPTSRVGDLVVTQVLPIAIPLFVLFMSRSIAREQLLLAWVAVAASVICSSARLILTNRRQRRISENLLTTEKALRVSEHLLSLAFRNSPDAFSINPFPNGPYLEVNDGFTRLTGYTREETLGKTPRQMNLWLDPSERDQALAKLTNSGEVRDIEFRFRNKSGQIRVGQMSASVVDLDGQRCSIVVVRDVTERKDAESILRSSEERFRSLVRDLRFGVVLYTPDGRIEFANNAAYRLFNVAEGSAIGKLVSELGISAVDKDGNDIPDSDRPLFIVLRTGVPIRDLIWGFRGPGLDNILWIFGDIIPQLDANGNIIRLITSFADVTEMRNAERAIHQLSKQLLRLQDEERRHIGRELHDGLAQTVLAINLSLAQVRQSLSSNEDPAVRPLEKARALTQQMSREIRTLSYLLHPPLLDDLGLLSALKEYTRGFTDRSGIETSLILPGDFDRLPRLLELALFRIVQESLSNIQRHSGSPTAQISLRQEDSLVILEVSDSGRGMTLPANGHPQPREPRLGVGIPGMRERIAQLGGHLDIISAPTGTTVRTTISLSHLPATETDDEPTAHPHRG